MMKENNDFNSMTGNFMNQEETAQDQNVVLVEALDIMKVTFTYGDTVKITLTQDNDGYYIYTPKNNLILPIKFFSVKDAILFFSNFLPTTAYDKEENSLSFEVTLEYENKSISFFMKDDDKTKIAWTNYSIENKGFNDFWSKNRKVDDSINDIIRYFITFVDTKKEKAIKKLTVEYLDYKLQIEINPTLTSNMSGYPYIKGTCKELDSFTKSGYYENPTPIIEDFVENASFWYGNKFKDNES